MLLILTGAIQPATTEMLVITDVQERRQQYIDSIRFFIESKAFDRIIFCENSNYGINDFQELIELAKTMDMELEVLSFQGNARETEIHGKGYGEGEIMKYVFDHSLLIRGESYFMKITGRLKIDNIKSIVAHMYTDRFYFNVPNRTHREMYDTRIYGMPAQIFKTKFIDIYNEVNDREGRYLENIYTSVITANKIKIRNFPRFPRIIGVSGSTGAEYRYSEWKCKIKDILSLFGYYKVINKGKIRE